MGDWYGIPINHGIAAGMGGIRTAGDLVLRVQMAKKMRIDEAKLYVAQKLGIEVRELSDVSIMRELRNELNIGEPNARPENAFGLIAKARIEKVLDIPINSVQRFKKMIEG